MEDLCLQAKAAKEVVAATACLLLKNMMIGFSVLTAEESSPKMRGSAIFLTAKLP